MHIFRISRQNKNRIELQDMIHLYLTYQLKNIGPQKYEVYIVLVFRIYMMNPYLVYLLRV